MASRLSADAAFVRRFQAEMVALRRVRHAAVVALEDWGQEGGRRFLVMERVEGESLATRLGRGALSEGEARALGAALAEGLAACHAAGVVHRDLKPDNIMLRADGAPVLIDFGIALQAGEASGQTQMGTPGFAPPEQLSGEEVGPEADLYALAETLARCVGGWRRASEGLQAALRPLRDPNPARRGAARDVARHLSPRAARLYHAARPGEAPRAGLSAEEAARAALEGEEGLLLWWEGQAGWVGWREVEEVSRAAQALRPPPLPTPPPVPPRVPTRAEPSAGAARSVLVQGVELKMSYCPPGEFWMGLDEDISFTWDGKPYSYSWHRPRHRVKLTRGFWMGQTQVTQALWEKVMGSNPSHFKGATLPVEMISWFDAGAMGEGDGFESESLQGSDAARGDDQLV